MWIERLEQRLEQLHGRKIFRVCLLIFFSVAVSYVNVWLHEFCHFIYAVVVLHDSNAAITYDDTGLFMAGYCKVTKADWLLYYVGGLGSGVVLLVCWLFLLSIPHKNTVPIEVPIFVYMLVEFVYGICEGTWIVFRHEMIVAFVVVLVTVFGCITYLKRVREYLKGGE